MGVRSLLVRAAVRAPIPVFAVGGRGGGALVDRLRLDERLQLVDAPRSATVLLVAGELTAPLLRPLLRIHDMIPPPRRTVVATPVGAAPRWAGLLGKVVVVEVARAASGILEAYAQLLRDGAGAEQHRQPAVEPAPWRGVGPYGQGGKGMTGGVPFGRPMAGTAPDRDGLELDQIPLLVGPFFPAFPVGLTLDLRLQGDVIQEAYVLPDPFVGCVPAPDVFRRALDAPLPIATLEVARAREHLCWAARALRLHGLAGLGLRALRLARRLEPGEGGDAGAHAGGGAPAPTGGSAGTRGAGAIALVQAGRVRALARLVERTRTLRWAMSGVGRIAPDRAGIEALGPVARACGMRVDARLEDPAYRALDFRPPVQSGGDAWARWRQRLEEAVQSLELAAGAGTRLAGGGGVVEGPRGRLESGRPAPSAVALDLLPELLVGQAWGDAVATVMSLDLELAGGGAEP